jgi:hypothetical protein
MFVMQAVRRRRGGRTAAMELSSRGARSLAGTTHRNWRIKMGRGMLLWLIGIPLPIILVIWLFGGLS